MRAKDFLPKSQNPKSAKVGKLPENDRRAMPATYVLPKLKNQDMYLQYRMGVALAAARAAKEGLIQWDETSAFGENMTIVARSKEEQEQVELALKMMPGYNEKKMVSTSKSEEDPDTNIKSLFSKPTKKFKP